MDFAPHCPPRFGAVPPALPPRDRAVVSVVALALVSCTALGFAAGYLAAPSPLDLTALRCASLAMMER